MDRSEMLDRLKLLLDPWIDDTNEEADVDESSDLLGDLGVDSVGIMQVLLGIEQEFGITIKDHEIDSEVFSRMGNLIDLIEGKINETVGPTETGSRATA